ncbi:MAG: hypothetical protein V3W06_10735, partial [Acidimicrobiia bacterium]
MGSPESFELQPGATVTCDFENTKRGNIIVQKEVVSVHPDAGSVLFDFTSSYGSHFSLADGESNGPIELVPGIYSVAEEAKTGWDLSSLSCADPDGGSSTSGATATVDLDPGETVTCTFENTQRGEIIIDKVTVPSDSTEVFYFYLTGGELNEAFTLTNGQPEYHSGLILPGAGYLAEQIVPEGWDPSVVNCSSSFSQSTFDYSITPEAMSAEIDLAPGDTVTCVFNNTERGQIIIDKVTYPERDSESFNFSLTGGPDDVLHAFGLADASGIQPSGFLLPSDGTSYVITEAAVADWDLAGVECTTIGVSPESETSSTWIVNLEAGTATIDLAAGETVTCTFTNTKRGNIVVVKQLDGTYPSNPSLIEFDYTLNGPNGLDESFTINLASPWYDVAAHHGLLPSGDTYSYSISEALPAGWELAASGCDNGSSVNDVTVPPGDTVVCTFTNEMLLHAGSIGFWKNRHEISDAQFSTLFTAATTGSAVYVGLTEENAVAVGDAIFKFGSGTTDDQRILAQ